MGKYTVTISKRANAMLIDHTRFLANVSVSAAQKLVSEFENILDILEDNPFQFPIETEYDFLPGEYRKALFGKRYKALFMVEDHTVYMDAVLDCRQDNTKNLSE